MQKPQVVAVCWGELQEVHGMDKAAGLHLLRATTLHNDTLHQQELGPEPETAPPEVPTGSNTQSLDPFMRSKNSLEVIIYQPRSQYLLIPQ